MTYLENFLISFERRPNKEKTLCRMTRGAINLNTINYERLKPKNTLNSNSSVSKSYYERKLINEILPEINVTKQSRCIYCSKYKNRYNSAGHKKSKKLELAKIEEFQSNKKNLIPIKTYEKKCDNKSHFKTDKFICNFLTPINHFLCNDFQLYNNEYDDLTKKLKKGHKKFYPPKIPNYDNKLKNGFKELKFKI